MALKLGSLNKSRQSFSGGGSENVAVMIAEIHLADKTKKSINVAEDYATAYLLEDGFGKKAEFNYSVPEGHDEYGSPLTSVKIKMKDRKLSGEHAPMEIWDLQVGKRKGAALPMGQFPTVMLENAYLDNRTDTVMVGWLTVGQREFGEPNSRVLPGVLVTVESERYDMRDNERRYRQNRFVSMPEDAATFDGLESFKAAVTTFLQPNPDAAGGQPVATIRIIDNDSVVNKDKVTEIGTTTIYPGWNKDEQKRMSPEETVEAWLANGENATWVEYIGMAATEKGYTFEVIPGFKYSTGRESLPSRRGKGIDDAENFRIPVEDREKGGAHIAKQNGDGFLTTNGYTRGSMLVRRKDGDDGDIWYATKTFRKSRFGAVYMKDELVTPNVPADVAKAFEDAAVARGEAARENLNRNRAAQQDSAPSQQDDEIPFGEPDHSGGLTPQ